MEVSPISSKDKAELIKILDAEIAEALGMLGLNATDYGSGTTNNYMDYPDS